MILDDVQRYFLLELLFFHLGKGRTDAMQTLLTEERLYRLVLQELVEFFDKQVMLTDTGWAWLESNFDSLIPTDCRSTTPRLKFLEFFISNQVNHIPSRAPLSSTSDKFEDAQVSSKAHQPWS